MSPPDPSGRPAAQERILRERLQGAGYLADEDLATTVWLASALQRPLLIEGDAGVGKTALATALAQSQNAPVIRLQCFEGLDLAQAAYEWNYGRQLMAIRMSEAGQDKAARVRESDVFSRDYLLERPLLRAISQSGPCVLLIDEIDRADEAFEAFLLEVLARPWRVKLPSSKLLCPRPIPTWWKTQCSSCSACAAKTWPRSPALPRRWTGCGPCFICSTATCPKTCQRSWAPWAACSKPAKTAL